MVCRLAFAAALAACLATGARAFEPDPLMTGGERAEGDIYQWYLPAVGLDAAALRAIWEDDGLAPVVVAVIDSGLDYDHPDLATANLWTNEREQPNGLDDDGNGYVDDIVGWDFIDLDNDPWDWVGHGTHVAGVIAAQAGNGEGIAGLCPTARIMPLRAMNEVGRGLSTRIAEAIYYAVDHGARVINLSVAIADVSSHEQKAIAYAMDKGVLVVAASGNEGKDAGDFTPASIPGVLTVGATGRDGARAAYSNWGTVLDLVAPGTDILSLRAANTDFMHTLTDDGVTPLYHMVGPDTEYYLATGTSFAAPLVTGAAALLLAREPSLTADDLRRILVNAAADLGDPGADPDTGYGLLDIPAALTAKPGYFLAATLAGVGVVVEGNQAFLEVRGTADADRFEGARIELGAGADPGRWKTVADAVNKPVRDGVLGRVPQGELAGGTTWTVRLVVEHKDGSSREARLTLNLG